MLTCYSFQPSYKSQICCVDLVAFTTEVRKICLFCSKGGIWRDACRSKSPYRPADWWRREAALVEWCGKGQRRSVLHLQHTLLKSQIYVPYLNSRNQGDRVDSKRGTFSPNAETILPPQGQSLPEGKEPACVLGEEMLMLALILKGPLKSITLSSLQRREINMFLKAKRAACGACVWPSLIQPEAFGGKLFLKKNYRVSRSNGFSANTISKFLTHVKNL